EMAENLVEKGLEVTLIEMQNQVMAPLDYEMAAIVHNHLREKGVQLILEDGVTSFADQGEVIVLSSGEKVKTDMTLMSIGVKPENKLALDAGLTLVSGVAFKSMIFFKPTMNRFTPLGTPLK